MRTGKQDVGVKDQQALLVAEVCMLEPIVARQHLMATRMACQIHDESHPIVQLCVKLAFPQLTAMNLPVSEI